MFKRIQVWLYSDQCFYASLLSGAVDAAVGVVGTLLNSVWIVNAGLLLATPFYIMDFLIGGPCILYLLAALRRCRRSTAPQ